ncbi:MAG: hypothetical protein ACO3JL_10410 [Myxococcota bacterium]
MPIPRAWRVPAEQLCADVEVLPVPSGDGDAEPGTRSGGARLVWGLLAIVLAGGLGWALLRPGQPSEGAPVATGEATMPRAAGASDAPASVGEDPSLGAAPATSDLDAGGKSPPL